MTINAATTVIPGRGTVFLAGPNTPPFDVALVDPADPATYPGWECMGHTSRDNTVALTKDGGDVTVKGSWLDPNMVAQKADTSWGMTVNSLQVDYLTLSTAWPEGEVTADGGYVIPSDAGSIEKAVLVYGYGSGRRMGFYAPRVSLSLGDAPSIDTENFFEIQISGSMLSATEAITAAGIKIGSLLKLIPPVAISVPSPAVSSATPPAAVANSTLTINGLNLQGTTAVTIGGTAATQVTQVNRNRVTVRVPAGTAGSAPIVVTNGIGPSASFPYTRGA